MAITTNRNTTQQPMSAAGLTGVQVLKFIVAPRLYVKTPDSLSGATPPIYISNGATPSGWTDLGIVEGDVKLGIEKKVKQVKTGMDNYFRAAYTDEKIGSFEVTLAQFDDVVFSNITGLIANVVNSGSIVSYNVGSEDLNTLAILIVAQNKLDGKEVQFYNPAALINFDLVASTDCFEMKVNGLLPFFTPTGASSECMLSGTFFTANAITVPPDDLDVPLVTLGDNTLDIFGDVALNTL